MTINTLLTSEDNWVTLWPDSDKNFSFSRLLLPFFSTTDEILNNQYILNLVGAFNEYFNNWVTLMGNEELVITSKETLLLLIKNQFNRWILKNALAFKSNYESLLLAINDTYNTSRTYTNQRTESTSSTYREGFNGGGLNNQQGTKLSNSSTNQIQNRSEDTDKYTQTDTLRQLNYLQLIQPFNFDEFFRELEQIIFIPIWS